MPTTKYFDQHSPFPSDVPIVPLPKVSLEGLQNGNREVSRHLFQACQEWGFFSLDLRSSQRGNELLEDAGRMFDLTRETFHLDQSILDNFAYKPPGDLTGYKRKGQLKTDDGKMDCMELYNISQDDILGNCPSRRNADPIEAKRIELRQFIDHSHSIIDVILSRLDDELGLESGTLSALSPLDQISETSIRLLRSQSEPSSEDHNINLGGHTDIGSITLLFNVVGGLQILPADRENKLENWLYVKPEPGHAIVNIGDTLVEWTGGLLRSSLHRVVTAPGEQALETRESVAYLVRPRNSASMQRLKGGIVPPLKEGEDEETCSVHEWAAWRAKQVMLGQLKPQTKGGKSVVKAV
ncbi:hypothetical protein N7523_007789 [Penicillium sp. IBT 18751x]|nr:hypothetical protein N7523_007789 [Penicillium sp. IBT 18751x]